MLKIEHINLNTKEKVITWIKYEDIFSVTNNIKSIKEKFPTIEYCIEVAKKYTNYHYVREHSTRRSYKCRYTTILICRVLINRFN